MAGTLTPTPFQTVLDDTGVASPGALIYTYTAGTTTAAATYTTSALSVANANPIVADSAGRYVAYLAAGANMKFVYKTAAGATIRTQDNVLSVPGAAVNLDIQGTVGVAVTAGQVCYLSSGAEATPLTPGLWYLTDADFAVSSTTCQSIGMAVSAIPINTAGTIRIAGLATTAAAVVVGSTYYVSATAGAITTSAPALSRVVGVADTTSTLILAATSAVAATLPNPIAQDVLFVDATYDIGKSGASRPRDLFQSRNATIGGTLGVTGATSLSSATVSSTLGVTGATSLSSATVSSTLGVTGAATLASTLAVTGVATLTGGLNTPLTVPNGGTGVATRTAYGVIVGGTTSTGAEQTIVPGTSGYLLTSGGASAVPTWSAPAAGDSDQIVLGVQVFS
jgi:fibronectin-binding autotransporter adhesin